MGQEGRLQIHTLTHLGLWNQDFAIRWKLALAFVVRALRKSEKQRESVKEIERVQECESFRWAYVINLCKIIFNKNELNKKNFL